MKQIKWILSTVLVICVISTVTNAQATLKRIIKKGELRVGITGNQPPFAMKAKTGEYIGYEIDLATMLAESMSVKLELVPMDFNKLIPALEDGEIDLIMSGMTITPERNMRVAFVGPYMVSGKSILTKSRLLSRSESTDDINQSPNMRIAVLEGSTSEIFANTYITNADISPVKSYDQAIDMLRNDVVKAVVADYPFTLVSALKYSYEGIVSLEEPLTIEPIGTALAQGDPLFLNLVQNYMNSIELAGIFDELNQKWLQNGMWLLQVE
ncbi:transporter substrate-binding domain-containing protein [Reichenbachiella agariperforans]|uniref:transporter substrate-binding domain-containing protein n=1 Tax=Reichenbachiella agariperforans TaxID=156994 RepID=UPI001C09E477|nr:transporter substrate-binding domain-containing protein [Reichenbachiella agariperforans]MBU2916001.1 transporter substrate-binding domain-containing protein [Reichenbachiella agariperforans]